MKLTLLIAFLAFATIGCSEEAKVQPPAMGNYNADQPSQTTYNATIRFLSEGMLRAVLNAGRIRTYEVQHYTLLDSNVKVDFYDRQGHHSSVLTSRVARINDINKNMLAYQNVHIVSDSGTIVDTDSLEWDNTKQTLHSESGVKIVERSGKVTTGLGFQSDQNLVHYQILRPTITGPSSAFQSGSNTTNALPGTPGPASPFSPNMPTQIAPPTVTPSATPPPPVEKKPAQPEQPKDSVVQVQPPKRLH